MNKILEIACFNLASTLIAEKAGADRIELCENYPVGGVSPSQKIISEYVSKITIPVFVMIRPRGGNFEYTKTEADEMKQHIIFCKEQNVNGIVFGCLTKERKIDIDLCKELIALAKPMRVTFHRAIDECTDIESAIKILIDLGFDRVLTTGGKSNALEGKEIIKTLQLKYGRQIEMMPGGGIRSTNINEILNTTQCSEFHSAALANNSEICDAVEIEKMKKIISTNE